MLLQNSPSLENTIIKLLSTSPGGLTADQIGKMVAKLFKQYSRRGIYKELQRLIYEGVLIRSKSHYSLRLAWVLALQNEIELFSRQVQDPEYLRLSLPTKEEDLLVHCNDLVSWDRVWTQLMLVLHTTCPKLPMFIWCPRHWFTITHPEIESTFTKANEIRGHLRYAIVGGRTKMDLQDKPVLARKSTAYSFRVSPFEYDRNHYYWIIGDFCGTSTLDLRTAERIDNLYKEAKNNSEILKTKKDYLLSQKCRGTVKCEYAPKKATKYRKKFLDFFGIKLKENGELVEIKRGEL